MKKILAETSKKYIKKTLLFFSGCFTITAITGGWLYDVFGTSDFAEIGEKLMHPSVWLDGFTVYTIAFLTFRFLPEKISKCNLFMRFFYFVCYYFILMKAVRLLVY